MPHALPPDEDAPVALAVPHFEEQLLDRLQERRESGAWTGRRGHRWRRLPRPSTRLGLAAAVTVVALAAGAVVTRAAHVADDDGPDLDTAATEPDDGLPAGIRPILTALDAAIDGGSIAHVTSLGGLNEAWIDLGSGGQRVIAPTTPGHTFDWGRSQPPPMEIDRTWSDGPVGRRIVDDCLHQYADTREPELRISDSVTPLRDELARGDLQVTGPVTVDGRELLRLDSVVEPPASTGDTIDDRQAAVDAYLRRRTVFVDPATQLPVRIEEAVRGVELGDDGSYTTIPADPSQGSTIEYLPRSPETLALLVPPVPAGYTRVEQPALDEVRAAGCVG